jgi:hypothetical protein
VSNILGTLRWANEMRLSLPAPQHLLDMTSERYQTLSDGQELIAAAANRNENTLRAVTMGQQAIVQSLSELRVRVDAQSAALNDLADVRIQRIHELLQAALRRSRDSRRDRAGGEVKIDFLFQLPDVWTSWTSIWESCKGDERVRARLILVPFLHDSQSDPNRSRRFLADQGYSFLDWSAYDLDRDGPDVVFLQNPYDSTRPPALSTEEFEIRGIRIAYVPYGLEVGGGDENIRWQYDLEVQRKAWRIFARSPQHKRMFGLHCGAGNEHVVITGHPKFDQIIEPQHAPLSAATRDAAQGRRVVLWCPHFTVGGTGWSTYERYSSELLSLFENRSDVTLLVRPHPLLFGRMREMGLLSEAGELALRRRLASPPNILLDESGSYLSAFAASDALMTDAGSFLLEYLPTTRPILYLENPDGPGLNESGSFASRYYRAHDFEDVRRFVQMVADGEDPGREERLRLIREELFRTDGQIGRSIKDHVVEAIASEASGF